MILIWLTRRTHVLQEIKAHVKGVPLSVFFYDDKRVEFLSISPEAGVISDDKLGQFLINEHGTYVDRRTRNVVIPFSASISTGASVKVVKMADDILKVVKDPMQLDKIREEMLYGNESTENLAQEWYHSLRESVNFGALKYLMTSITPHGVNAKINLTIAQRLKSFGQVDNKMMFFWIIAIIGAIGLMAMVLYFTIGGGSGGAVSSAASGIGATASSMGSVVPAQVIAG